MTTNVPNARCAVYDWCGYAHTRQQGGHHRADIDLVEMLDDSDMVIEVSLYADSSTPPVVRVMFPSDDGITAYIDLPGEHAGHIAHMIAMFEGPGFFDRRGLREFAQLLTDGAAMVGEVTEL